MAPLRYLLDTNVVSAVIKAPDGPIARRLAGLPRETFAISVVVAAELHYGVIRKGSPKLASRVQALLDTIDVLPLEQPVDQHYGSIRSDLARFGQPIGQNDLLIAAHARALGLVLVTDNVREFARVPGLVVENWQAAPGR